MNVCGLDLLPKIKMDPNSMATSSLFIQGFNNSGKTTVGTVILSLKVGQVTIPTLVHVILGPLSYNLLLRGPWLHALGFVSSTLHGSMKFMANNQVITVKADPEAMQLCQIVTVGQDSVTHSFQNYVPTLSSSIVISTSVSSPKKEECKKEDVTKEVVKKEKSTKKQDSS